MSPYDDPDYGPGYDEPDDTDARNEAFHEGAASREKEISFLSDELRGAEQVIAEQRAEIERLKAALVEVGKMEAA